MTIVILCIKIFLVRIIDVSLGTLRTIITVKGRNMLASMVGFVEVFVWFIIAREALNTDVDSIWIAISYSLGFATGTYIGGYLSDRFISGNLGVQVVTSTKNDKLIQKLTELGYIHQGFYITMDEKKDLEPRWLSVLELENKTTDEILKEMRTTTRWSIRNSEKNCLRIIECSRDDLKEFKLLMKHTAERREFIDRPLSYYQNMYDVLSKEDLIKVLLVEINFKELLEKTTKEKEELLEKIERSKDNPKKQNQLKELTQELTSFDKRIESLLEYQKKYGDTKIIAGGLYMLYGRQLVYLLGASYKEFMKYNSQYLLQWQMINYAKEHNYQTFNFYGIDGDFSKESKNYGLFDFKRGFSACVVELIGEFDLVINKPLYHLYKLAFKTYKTLKNIKNHIKK